MLPKGISLAFCAVTLVIASANSVFAQESDVWKNPKDQFGPGWGCASMEVDNPTYDICKQCDSVGGRFVWKVPPEDGRMHLPGDARTQLYEGRCESSQSIQPKNEGEKGTKTESLPRVRPSKEVLQGNAPKDQPNRVDAIDGKHNFDDAAAIAAEIFPRPDVPPYLVEETSRVRQSFLRRLFGSDQGAATFLQLGYTRNPFSDEDPESASLRKQCNRVMDSAFSDINVQISRLYRSLPRWGEGAQVEVGSCASRLRLLAGNLICCNTFKNIAPVWEEISCLELKKFYLRKSCECADRGQYSKDPVLQDGILERYGALMQLRHRALHAGVKDRSIRAVIDEAQKAVDCMNYKSLAILNAIEVKAGSELLSEH